MSLRDELAGDQSPSTKCAICTWLKTLPAKERAEWVDVLSDQPSFSHASIFRAMDRRKVPGLKASTVGTHRTSRHRLAE